MLEHKYYDDVNNRLLDLELDGCDLESWGQLHGRCRFARHPEGFLVFLPPDKLDICDEYAVSDPYEVEQNIDGEFHGRRIELTVALVREAVSAKKDKLQILDLGCGQGHISDKIRQALKGAEVTGLDYSLSSIEYAHGHFPEVEFAVGDAYNSPFAPGFFDVVVCNNLWEHVSDPLFLLSKIRQITKPGGHLVISTPSRYRVANLLRILRGRPVSFMSGHHVTEYTVGQVKEQLTYGGFEVKRVASRPIAMRRLKTRVARSLLSGLISLVGSHHQLEATVFYLAQKNPESSE